MTTSSSTRLLVLDTNAWLFLYGLGPGVTVTVVRTVVDALRFKGYRLAYTSVSQREIKLSPRPEVSRVRYEVLSFMQSTGVRLGPGYWQLISQVEGLSVPEGKENDAGIVLASKGHVLLASDSWMACYALENGVDVIYVQSTLE